MMGLRQSRIGSTNSSLDRYVGTNLSTLSFLEVDTPQFDLQCADSSFLFFFFCTLTWEASSIISPFGSVVRLDSGTHNFSSFPGAPIVSPSTYCIVLNICHIELYPQCLLTISAGLFSPGIWVNTYSLEAMASQTR